MREGCRFSSTAHVETRSRRCARSTELLRRRRCFLRFRSRLGKFQSIHGFGAQLRQDTQIALGRLNAFVPGKRLDVGDVAAGHTGNDRKNSDEEE